MFCLIVRQALWPLDQNFQELIMAVDDGNDWAA
ncbi:hypothetical protein ACJIZ3_014721 [Penstemon smallii]